MLFCECLSALQQSWTSLNRITDRNDQQLRPTAHTISSPHFSQQKKKLFFGVRSPSDRDRTFCVFQFLASRGHDRDHQDRVIQCIDPLHCGDPNC